MRTSRILAVLALVALCSVASAKKYWDAPAGQGTSTVGSGGDYATLALAAADYNTTAPLGDWTMEIISNITETAVSNFFNETNGHTITIKPASTNPGVVTITFPNSGGGAEWGGSLVVGVHNTSTALHPRKMDGFTIDGDKDGGTPSRDLTLTQAGTSASHMIVVAGDTDNMQIKNLTIICTTTSASSRYGIRSIGVGWEGAPQENLLPDNGLIENCSITITGGSACQGISNENSVVTGHVGVASTNAQTGWTIRNNDITARTRGIFMNATAGITVENNRITINQTGSGFLSWGIWHLGSNAANNYTQVIRNNRIVAFNHAVSGTNINFGPTGISMQGAGAASVGVKYEIYNNMVGGFNMTGAAPVNVQWRGIMLGVNAPSFYVYHNSVYMPDFAAMSGSVGNRVYGIGAESSPSLMVVKNNIVYVGESGASCITKTGTGGTLISDNNVLFTNGVANTGRIGTTDYATLGDWQGAGQDANSVSQNPFPMWTSNSDLHFASAPGSAWKVGGDISSAVPAAGVAFDFDGAGRDQVNPYVGVDEVGAPDTTFTVVSAYGSPSPAVGVSNTTSGTLILATVASPVAGPAGTQYVCTGYTGTGGAPTGAGNSASFTITTPATLTWNWQTQYSLTTAANPPAGGSVTGAGWYNSGDGAPVQATANPGYHFDSWVGDLAGNTNPDTITMGGPRNVTANFTTPEINLPETAHNYGSVLVGDPAVDYNFAVQNVGGYALAISDVSRISGSTDFTVQSAPASVAANTTGTLTIRYTPNTAGAVSAVIQITSDDIDETTTTLSVSAFGISSNTAVIGGHINIGAWTPASAPTMNDLGINGDVAGSDMIFTLQVDVPTTPTEWKVLKDKNLGFGGGNDVGRQADGNWNMPPVVGNGVKFFYDTRDLSASGWLPATEGLGSSAYSSITWVAVGSFQSEAGGSDWDPDSAVTQMHDDGLNGDSAAGDGIFTFQFQNSAPLTPGEWLVISNNGASWGGEIKFGSNGMAVDPGGVNQPQFTMEGANGTIKMEFDAWHGHIRLTLTPPAAVNDWTMY